MKNTDKARNKVFTFVHLVEHFKDNATYCLEKTIKKGTVIQKERTKFFINGKNAQNALEVKEIREETIAERKTKVY